MPTEEQLRTIVLQSFTEFVGCEMNGGDRKVVFNPLDRQADIDITSRNLPHWFQVDAAIFVTFRTNDSLPREVLLRWHFELQEWLKGKGMPLELAESTVGRRLPNHDQLLESMSIRDRREFRKLSDRIFHRSLDECHGACQLRSASLAKIVGDAIRYGDGAKYDLDSFIVMPNHVHAIVQFRPGGGLEIVSQSWMRFTARQINKTTGQTGPFWQPEPFDHIIRSSEQFCYLHDYIANNPINANLDPADCLYYRM